MPIPDRRAIVSTRAYALSSRSDVEDQDKLANLLRNGLRILGITSPERM